MTESPRGRGGSVIPEYVVLLNRLDGKDKTAAAPTISADKEFQNLKEQCCRLSTACGNA